MRTIHDAHVVAERTATFFAALSERRRRVGQALFAVAIEAHRRGVSTRKVDDLVNALGADSRISRISGLHEEIAAFLYRDLAAPDYPYVFLNATYC